jgi:aryl-alcohol dehydrogenase
MTARRASDKNVYPIQAAVLRKRGGPLVIESLEMDAPREDEVLVRLVASGICRTDIDFRDEWYDGPEPLVLGHEGAGVVERLGRKVKAVRAGDPVVLSYQSCGRCWPRRSSFNHRMKENLSRLARKHSRAAGKAGFILPRCSGGLPS